MNHERFDIHVLARLLFASVGLALVWMLTSFIVGSDSARADDGASGSLLGAVSDVVEATEVADLEPATRSASAVVAPVADAAPAPVKAAAAVIAPARTEPVEVRPITAAVTPVAVAVDEAVAATPVEALAKEPVTKVSAPVAAIADDTLTGAAGEIPELAALPLPGLTDPAGLFASAGPPASLFASDQAVASERATTVASVSGDRALGLSLFQTTGSDASSTRFYPDLVPLGPANHGNSAVPSPSGTGSGVSPGSPSGPATTAVSASGALSALISGALLSHAENDALPSSLAVDLSSTPD